MLLAALAGCAYGLTDDEDDLGDGFGNLESHDGQAGDGGEGNATAAGGSGGATTTTTTTTTAATTTAATTTSGSGGGSSCDMHGDCGTCLDCATTSTCANEIDACFADTECNAFVTCLNGCADDVCADACAQAHPAGTTLYMIATECAFCTACPADCAAEGQGLCV
jgi:hypothetical protein